LVEIAEDFGGDGILGPEFEGGLGVFSRGVVEAGALLPARSVDESSWAGALIVGRLTDKLGCRFPATGMVAE
jgi:hypothetical protein